MTISRMAWLSLLFVSLYGSAVLAAERPQAPQRPRPTTSDKPTTPAADRPVDLSGPLAPSPSEQVFGSTAGTALRIEAVSEAEYKSRQSALAQQRASAPTATGVTTNSGDSGTQSLATDTSASMAFPGSNSWSYCRFESLWNWQHGWCGMFWNGSTVTSNEWAVGFQGLFEGVSTPSPYHWHWWVRGWSDSCWRWKWIPASQVWQFYYLDPQTNQWAYQGYSTSRYITVNVFARINCWTLTNWYTSELEYAYGYNPPAVGSTAWSHVDSIQFLLQSFGCAPPPTPTPLPTMTPTPTRTPTPTPTLPPWVTPTPHPRATPTPTPVARPTAAPNPLAPSGCNVAPHPGFSWTAVSGASHYEFYLLKDNPDGSSDTLHHQGVVNGTNYQVPAGVMVLGAPHRWKVRAVNSQGTGPYSGGGGGTAFTPGCSPATLAPPPAPTPLCLTTLQPSFIWGSVAGASNYRLYVGDWQPDPQTGQTTVLNVVTPYLTYTPTAKLKRGRNYYWKVKALSSTEEGAYSALVSFNTNCAPPPPVDEQRTDMRTPNVGQGPGGAPSSVGCPVSVTNGNMFLDQADLSVAGVGPVLAFTRSYNSDNIVAGRYGIFGAGWTHPFEATVRVDTDESLVLTEANGTPLYFWDTDSDRRYDPYVPATEQSWIILESDGRYTRHFRAGGQETFDAQGRLLQVTDRLGMSLTIERDGSGKIVKATNASQRWIAFTYAGSRLTEVADGAGLTRATYTYDGSGRLSGVTYLDGSGYTFAYEASNRLQTVTDRTGRVVETHEYYANGKARTSSLADGRDLLTLIYGTNQTTVTNALGHVATYDFVEVNQTRRVVKITGPCSTCGSSGGEVQEWTYDAAGRVQAQKDSGGKVTRFEYDPDTGDLIRTKDALLNATFYTYYEDGRVKSITTPDNATRRYTYAEAGPETITESIDSGRSRTQKILYNAAGQPAITFDFRGNRTTYTYSATAGDLESVATPAGTTRFVYDGLGRVRETKDPREKVTRTEYDGRGRVKKVTYPDGTTSEVTYDLAGRQVTSKDALGRESRTVYDAYGRPVESIDPLRNVTRQSYDFMSRPTSITDAEGRTTNFDRDAYGRVVRTVYPGGAVESMTYDQEGRLASRTDRKGTTTTYQYDALGRLQNKTYSDGSPTVAYTYDEMSRMKSASNSADTLGWTYDHLSRLLTESSSRHGSTVAYTYDDQGNRLTLSLNGTTIVTYSYDEASRLDWLRHEAQTVDFDYDAASRRTSMTYPNGVITTYDLDDMGRLREIKALKGSQPVSTVAYEYDAAGNRTRKTTLDFAEEYGYDTLSRLVRVQRGTTQWAFDYDRVGNRTVDRLNGTVSKASHDQRNQLLSKAPGGMVAVEGTLNEPASASINGQPAQMLQGNRFAGQVDSVPGSNEIAVQATDASGNTALTKYAYDVSGQPAAFEYDLNGNLVRRTESGSVWTYEWTVENQLARVLRDGTEVARFAYDPVGRRIEKVAGAVTHAYLYDGQDVLRETTTGALNGAHLYIHGPGVDEPLVRKDEANGLATYYHVDGLGSIINLTDGSGVVVHSYRYDAWGTIEVGASMAGYAFTGREWDPEVGFYYHRARYYDPRAGVFLSEDPIGFAGGINFHAYVGGSPTNRIDPLGLSWQGWWNTAVFFHEWAHGTGEATRYYGPNDLETQDMRRSAAMAHVRQLYIQNGCKDGRYFEGTLRGYWDTFAGDLATNPTAFQVGGFRADFTSLGDGRVAIHIYNEASLGSAIGESAVIERFGGTPLPWLHRERGRGWRHALGNAIADLILDEPFRVHPGDVATTIRQHFDWIESRP